jgi:hypothetical protein
LADLLQQTRWLNSVAENLRLLSLADTDRLALRATEFDLRKLLDGSLENARSSALGIIFRSKPMFPKLFR